MLSNQPELRDRILSPVCKASSRPKAVIFDLGDVLFNWSPHTTTSVPAKVLKKILASSIWADFERGSISQESCYQQAAQAFSVPVFELAEAFRQARASLRPNEGLVSFIRGLSVSSSGSLKIYAMSNISKEDFAFLLPQIRRCSLFHQVFASGHVGMRKPDLEFYRHVLGEIELEAKDVVFIDDKKKNVLAAQSLGIKSIVFDNNTNVARNLSNLFDCHLEKARQYLRETANHFDSITDTGVVIPDNFARLLILEATQDSTLVDMAWSEGKRTWNFFAEKPKLIPGGKFPDDLDTTSLALMMLRPKIDVATSVLTEILDYVNPDGSVQVYFDRAKIRVDPVVSSNVLACFYSFGRGHELENTLDLIRNVIIDRKYTNGTHYYSSADVCLHSFTRLLLSSDDTYLQTKLGPILKQHLRERVGQKGNALDLAMRIIACTALDIECDIDRCTLAELQQEDGGWQAGWMYQFGSTGIKLGNRGVTTAMALMALS